MSPLAKEQAAVVVRPVPPPPIRPSTSRMRPRRDLAIPSTGIEETMMAVKTALAPVVVTARDMTKEESLRKWEFQLKSNLIGEKVKLYEAIRENKPAAGSKKGRDSFTRKIRKSLQGLFEKPTDAGHEPRKRSALCRTDLKDVEQNIQDDLSCGYRILKRHALVGDWSTIPQVSKGGDGTMSDTIDPPEVEKIPVMVVKEAECGLRQPKPLRVVEMKRMMMLCRERVGSMMTDKGMIVQTKKL